MSAILGPDGRPAEIEVGEQRPSRPPRAVNLYQLYEAAERADYRGWFYIPNLTPREQQNAWTRRALQERIDWLYINVPAVGMVIDGLALEETGTGLWPKWTSENPDFNDRITEDFHWANHDPRIFDAAGESDYYTAQYNVRRMIYRYGDCFGQLLRPSPGAINPQCSLIPGYRVENLDKGMADKGWIDGTKANSLGRIVAFQVRDDERSVGGQEVPADDLLHFHDPFFPGQRRGVSCLVSAAKKMFRREDILKALANGILAREKQAFALQTKNEGDNFPRLDGDGDTEERDSGDGGTYTVKRFYGKDASDELIVPRLPAGSEIKLLESNRPSDQVTEFLDDVLRELAWSAKRHPEYIFFLSKLGQGTVARLVLQKEVGVTAHIRATQLVPQLCHRWNVFWAWQRILAGKYDSIKGGIPRDWYKHRLLGDADKSVDIGREGRLLDDRVATLRMSIDAYHSLAGADTADVDKSNFATMERRLKELADFNKRNGTEFTYFDLWPRSINNLPTPPDPAPPAS
jgi:hypothetical protein